MLGSVHEVFIELDDNGWQIVGHLQGIPGKHLKPQSNYQMLILLSFTNGVSKANIVKWKVSTKDKKLTVCIWMWSYVSVCLSVPMKKLNNFWWNERILMTFQDLSNSVQVIFGVEGVQIIQPPG